VGSRSSPQRSAGSVNAKLANDGIVGLGNDNLTYPAIGLHKRNVRAEGVPGSWRSPSWGETSTPAPVTPWLPRRASGRYPHQCSRAGPSTDGFSKLQDIRQPARHDPAPRGTTVAVTVGSNVCIAIGVHRPDMHTQRVPEQAAAGTPARRGELGTGRISEVSVVPLPSHDESVRLIGRGEGPRSVGPVILLQRELILIGGQQVGPDWRVRAAPSRPPDNGSRSQRLASSMVAKADVYKE